MTRTHSITLLPPASPEALLASRTRTTPPPEPTGTTPRSQAVTIAPPRRKKVRS